jgi:hypothetical protein
LLAIEIWVLYWDNPWRCHRPECKIKNNCDHTSPYGKHSAVDIASMTILSTMSLC